MRYKIALAQINPTLGNVKENIQKHISYCDKAIKEKADLIIFPELSLTGYSLKDLNFELSLNPFKSRVLEPLRKKSRKISIICGGVEEDDNYGVFNSAFYISDGRVEFTHRKVYPPDYGIFEEMRYFSKGKEVNVYETKFGKLGLLVCEDLWHISLPLIQALKGAKIIVTIAASPTRLDVNSHSKKIKNYEINSEHHKTYARLLSCYIVFCNRVGYEDGINFWGGSEVVAPFGNIVKVARFFEEELIFVDINYDKVKQARKQARHFLDEDINLLKSNFKLVCEEISRL